MKVNMSLIENEMLASAEDIDGTEQIETDEKEDSDKHSKGKTFLLVALMLVGLGLFVWNMTAFVNNMRLDNQGTADNVVYEMQDLQNFVDSSEGSKAMAIEETTENEMYTDVVMNSSVSGSEDLDTDSINRNNKGSDDSDTEIYVKNTDKSVDSKGSNSPNNSHMTYANESDEMTALRQEAQDALNEAALVKQELKNAEDMLDASLAREAELKNQLDGQSENKQNK